MPYILVRFRVRNYAAWKSSFDEHSAFRQSSGSQGGRVFRSADDASQVMVLMEWADLGRAQEFAQSEGLRQAMQEAGVVGQPDVAFLDDMGSFAT